MGLPACLAPGAKLIVHQLLRQTINLIRAINAILNKAGAYYFLSSSLDRSTNLANWGEENGV